MEELAQGLNTNGQAIAVISDNVANVSTTGYKASRAEFSDLVSSALGIKDNEVLGTGQGSQTVNVRTIQVSGDQESTGRTLDVAIGGEGFFTIGDPATPSYTRAGNFQLDKDGYLVSGDGQFVLGTPASTDGAATTTASKINLLQLSTTAKATSKITITGNLSSTVSTTTPPTAPKTFNEIGTAASAIQTADAYDTQGGKHTVTLAYFKTAPNTWTVQSYMDSGDFTGGTAGTPVLLGSKTGLQFQSDGTIAAANKAGAVLTATGTAAYANGAAAPSFTIDFSGYTQTANGTEPKSIVQDGLSTGAIKSYQFAKDGTIYASLSNGTTAKVATLQLSKFSNPDGLKRIGNNNFQATDASGKPTTGKAGEGGLGEINGGALERSTTDLATQFTDLVVFQRGYQANSQMLTQTSQILRDTIGLMR